MAQSQYFDGLTQSEKNSDQQFFTNVEEHTVQYVITPDKAQVQFPTQQIVVTSGEQLMVVDGQSQQIVIEQGGIAFQGQQIQQTQVQQIQVPQQQILQQQVVQPQYAVVQDNQLNNGTRQIYLVGTNNASNDRIDDTQTQQQPIVLNHQIGQNSTVRVRTPVTHLPVKGGVRQLTQKPQARPPIRTNISQQSPNNRSLIPNQQQIRTQSPNQNQTQMKPSNSNQPQIRAPTSNANQNQIRLLASNQQAPMRQVNLNQVRNSNPSFQTVRQSQANAIRVASPSQQLRPQVVRTPNQQFRPQSPSVSATRQPNAQIRPAQPRTVVGQVGQTKITGHPVQRSGGIRMTMLNQVQQLQQKVTNNQAIDLIELDIKPGDEQEVVSLADGTVVSVAAYKNMLADPKSRTALQKSNTPNQTLNDAIGVLSAGSVTTMQPGTATVVTTTAGPKKRNTPTRARQPAKGTAASRGRGRVVAQIPPPQEENQTPQSVNDPSRYAMANQAQVQQQMNKTPQYSTQQESLLQHQQRMIMQHQRPSQANYVIQPPKMHQRPQQQRPLPAYIPSSQIQKIIESTPISEEFSDSIRMLVLLENGEQRLITFTLPKEACTIQEILEQVNVPFQSNTNIQVTEANSNGINYIVTVGNVPPLGYEEEDSSNQEDSRTLQPPPTPPQMPPSPPALLVPQQQIQQPQMPQPQKQQITTTQNESMLVPVQVRKESPPPEPVKDQPRFVQGMLALCGACGYLSEDFNKCMRCQRKLPENVKSIASTLRSSNGQKREMILAQQRQQQMQSQQSSQQTQQAPPQQISPQQAPPQQPPQQQAPQQQTQQQQVPQQQVPLQQVLQQQASQQQAQQSLQDQQGATPPTLQTAPKASSTSTKPTQSKKKSKKAAEPESVHVISSDEEDDEKPATENTNILSKLGASITLSPISKEPSPIEIQKLAVLYKDKVIKEHGGSMNTTLICRTVRIGSYRCVPVEKKVFVDASHILLRVPMPSAEKQLRTIKVETQNMVKVLASFNPALPVFFFYLNPDKAKAIREMLGMTPDSGYNFDPLSTEEESYRRLTLLPDDIAEDDREVFHIIYGSKEFHIIEELNVKEANDILIKTCPKEISKATLAGAFTEIKQLLTYPPEGRGRISINTEDYVCLATDQFLNDVIIDFYLKYLVENLPEERRNRVHVFSTFFYKRLTTKPIKASRKSQPSELDPTLSAAQKRHARVKTWTKGVNLFEKDFIIVPINENAHWFLAIICFPGINGCQTWDGKPYVEEPRPRPKKKVKVGTIGTVSVTPVKQEKPEKTIVCEDPELSDKDEAEGEDSEMESDDSEDTTLSQSSVASSPASTTTPTSTSTPTSTPTSTATSIPTATVMAGSAPRTRKEPRPPIKQPCILIFDSLAGASRSRVVATLRDYLTCEHKAKMDKEKIYDRDSIKGACPKVPQQNNFTDCGLYVLQYVEQFFDEPISDYHIPIKEIKDWFEEIVVTKKREDIAILIRSLMQEYGKDTRLLPEISFPTLNGKVIDREFEDEEMEEEDEEEMGSFNSKDEEDDDEMKESFHMISGEHKEDSEDYIPSNIDMKTDETSSPIKPSSASDSGDFLTQSVVNPKPDMCEFPRQTSKDTLSILKAKRIIRHKAVDGPELKKHKSDQLQ